MRMRQRVGCSLGGGRAGSAPLPWTLQQAEAFVAFSLRLPPPSPRRRKVSCVTVEPMPTWLGLEVSSLAVGKVTSRLSHRHDRPAARRFQNTVHFWLRAVGLFCLKHGECCPPALLLRTHSLPGTVVAQEAGFIPVLDVGGPRTVQRRQCLASATFWGTSPSSES